MCRAEPKPMLLRMGITPEPAANNRLLMVNAMKCSRKAKHPHKL